MTVPFFFLLFPCPVCRGHFRSFYHDEILQQELMNVQTKPGAMFFAWKVHDVVTAWGVLFHEGSTSLTTYNRPQSGIKGRTSTIIGLFQTVTICRFLLKNPMKNVVGTWTRLRSHCSFSHAE